MLNDKKRTHWGRERKPFSMQISMDQSLKEKGLLEGSLTIDPTMSLCMKDLQPSYCYLQRFVCSFLHVHKYVSAAKKKKVIIITNNCKEQANQKAENGNQFLGFQSKHTNLVHYLFIAPPFYSVANELTSINLNKNLTKFCKTTGILSNQ